MHTGTEKEVKKAMALQARLVQELKWILDVIEMDYVSSPFRSLSPGSAEWNKLKAARLAQYMMESQDAGGVINP